MLNPDETMAKELHDAINSDLKAEFPNAKLRHAPAGAKLPAATVRGDLDAAIAKLETMLEAMRLLKAQL
jgi:hypothetical protein